MEVYLKSIWMFIKCSLEYKTSFILQALSSAIGSLFSFIAMFVLMNRFGTIDGWSINEICLTFSIALFGHVSTEMIARGLDMFHTQVQQGLLDRILVRPQSITLQVLCSNFNIEKIGKLLESIVVLIYGIISVNVKWNLYNIFVLFLMIVGAQILFFSILLIKASFSFWTIEGMEVMNIISDGGRDVSSYPISIYKKWFANIFTYVIPFGCINYYPLLYLLGKENTSWWYGLLPLVTIIFMSLSFKLWSFGIANYKSTGS